MRTTPREGGAETRALSILEAPPLPTLTAQLDPLSTLIVVSVLSPHCIQKRPTVQASAWELTRVAAAMKPSAHARMKHPPAATTG